MWWMVALDFFVILLLGAGIYYAWRLERMLRGLDRNRREMQKFVADFSDIILRAEKGIRELQDTAQDTGVEVDRQMVRAAELRDELTYLVDAADKIATRLTDSSSLALARRPEPPVSAPVPPKAAPVVEEKPVVVAPAKVAPAALESAVPLWAKRAGQGQVVINANPPRRTEPVQMQKATAALKQVQQVVEEPRPALRSEMERELQRAFEKIS